MFDNTKVVFEMIDGQFEYIGEHAKQIIPMLNKVKSDDIICIELSKGRKQYINMRNVQRIGTQE